MRVILIEEKDAKALLNKLELVNLRKDHPNFEKPGEPLTIDQMHRLFHYEVVRWLQDQGATGLQH